MRISSLITLALALIPSLPADPSGDANSAVALPDRRFEIGGVNVNLVAIEGVLAVRGGEGTAATSSVRTDLPRPSARAPFALQDAPEGEMSGRAVEATAGVAYPVYRDVHTGSAVVALDEIAVRLADGESESALMRWARGRGLEPVDGPQVLPEIYHLRIADAATGDAFAAAEAAQASGLVTWAEPVLWVEAERLAAPDDLFYALQWHLDNQFGAGGGPAGVDIDAPEAWEITTGSDDMVFAILDDGVDLGHPDIRTWVNADEPVDLADSDGNGFVDDVVGWDFVDNDSDPTPSHFEPPYDVLTHSDIHGTPVAGLVAAQGSNEIGVSGVSQRGQIMSLRVISAGEFVSPTDHARAIVYATNSGADVINMSYALPFPSREVEQAMIHALVIGRGGRGTPLFAAAGDESILGVRWPASSPWTIAVGSVTNFDTPPAQAAFSERLTLVAPSVSDLQGTATCDVALDDRGFDDLSDDYTLLFGGSSASTAMVSGAAGLLLAASPELTWWEVYQVLSQTAKTVPPGSAGDYDIFGFSTVYGWGRLSAGQAVARTLDPSPVEDPIEPNNDFTQLAPLSTPYFQHLVLRDPDLFAFEARGNEIITAHLWTLPTHPTPTLQLRGLTGSVILTATPTDSGIELNFLNSGGVTQPLAISVDPAPGSPPIPYTLSLRNRPLDSFEPNDVFEDAPLLPPAANTVISALLGNFGDIDIFAISGSAGDTVVAETTARRLPTPSPADTVLSLYRSDGVTPLAISDDHLRYDSRIEATLPANEIYYLIVRDYFGRGGNEYNYTLSISGFTPSQTASP